MLVDTKKDVFNEYVKYHYDSWAMWDIDPSYAVMRNISDKLWFDMEKRLWLAFLYSSCYCSPTAFVILSYFSDFNKLDLSLLEQRWKINKKKLIFQTDRRRIKSNDQFVWLVKDYKRLIWNWTQLEMYNSLRWETKQQTYENIYNKFINIKNMWRYTMFIYLEAVEKITDFWMYPTKIDLRDALSTRNWLAYAIGRDDLVERRWEKEHLSHNDFLYLQTCFDEVVKYITDKYPETNSNIWSVETTLCAFKKFKRWKRYVWYYLERAKKEFEKTKKEYPQINWNVFNN